MSDPGYHNYSIVRARGSLPLNSPGFRRAWFGRGVGLALAGFVGLEVWVVTRALPADQIRLPAGEMDRITAEQGAVRVVAEALYTDYLIPFELTAVLLLAAIVGAVVLAKRKV